MLILTALLLTGAVVAQTQVRSVASKPQTTESQFTVSQKANVPNSIVSASKSHISTSRAIVFKEGFESTTGNSLPAGWTKVLSAWVCVKNSDDNLPGVTSLSPAFAGERTMARSWQSANQDAWAFTPPIGLVGGSQYVIKFWYQAPGWPELGEFDNFEVKIGTAASAVGMTTTVFSHTNIMTDDWTQVSYNFTPATSGNYHLGFHNLNTAKEGIFVLIDEIEITGEALPGDCDPATNLTVEYDANCTKATLNWTMPTKKDEVTITQGGGPGTGVIGSSSGALSFGVYHRFTPADLAAVNNGVLNKIAFVAAMGTGQTAPMHTYTLRVYQGGTWSATSSERNPGTLVSEQLLNNADLDFEYGEDNIITLNTPVTIDASKELWVGYYCTPIGNQASYPALTDAGAPLKEGLGNVMNYQGWKTLKEILSNQNVNWYLYAKVSMGAPPPIDPVNIYRDGDLIKGNYTQSTYEDKTYNPLLEHTWEVKVICNTGGESYPVTKKKDPCKENNECLPVATFTVAPVNDGMELNWGYATKKAEITITQSYAPGTGVIGSSGSLSFGVYNRFRTEDLVAVNGGELNKFVFVPGMGDTQGGEPRHDYTIRIYQGGKWSATPAERSPGELIHSQLLNNDDLDFESGEDNVILLDKSITIDASKELWIGYWCKATSPGGYPALVDVGPRKAGLGDVMNLQGWTTLSDVIPGSTNWYMKGKVQYTPPKPTTVNIYRDGNKIKNEFEGTKYTDKTIALGVEYCYEVEVNCPNGLVSVMSEKKCDKKVGINEITKLFSIAPNPATNNVIITAGNSFHTVEVLNFLGQIVISQPVDNTTTTLDVSNLTNGVYFVRIISDTNASVQKFVKK